MLIKIHTPLRWDEDEKGGGVALIAADGAVIMSDSSGEIMPEWLDTIVLAVNTHDANIAAMVAAERFIATCEAAWHDPMTPERAALRAALEAAGVVL